MSSRHQYCATVEWQRTDGEAFVDRRYSRGHRWRFDGGIDVPASSSPLIVPLPCSVERAVDPEEAFVAALSSCHMLFFLSHAANAGLVVDRYTDDAVGVMGRDGEGRMAMLGVTLRPRVAWGAARQPAIDEVEALHERSHHECFLARSVRCQVTVDLTGTAAAAAES